MHLSTQLNISNIKALRFYAQFTDVVVLAPRLDNPWTRWQTFHHRQIEVATRHRYPANWYA